MISKIVGGGVVALALSVGANDALAQQAPARPGAEVEESAPPNAPAETRATVVDPRGEIFGAARIPRKAQRPNAVTHNVVVSTLRGVPGLVGSTVGGGLHQAGSTIGGAMGLSH